MAAVWSFLDRKLPQKASQISSPLFQQINMYHPMLHKVICSIPMYLGTIFYTLWVFWDFSAPFPLHLLDLISLPYLLRWQITKYSRSQYDRHYIIIGELAPLLSVLGTKCICATKPRPPRFGRMWLRSHVAQSGCVLSVLLLFPVTLWSPSVTTQQV